MSNDGQETSEEEIKRPRQGPPNLDGDPIGAAIAGCPENDIPRAPVPATPRLSEAGPLGTVNSFYGVAVMIPCDTTRGGCGALIKLTHADAMNGAAQGITFRVECPKCEATVTSRPHPGSPVVARLGNRKQRRARGAGR